MTTQAADSSKGLEGVVVAETRLSKVDGELGKLVYHGFPIEVLARSARYEEVIHLLWYLRLPTRSELEALASELKAQRSLDGQIIDLMRRLPAGAHPMGILRTAVSALGNFDPEQEDPGPEANRRKAVRLTARIPTIVAHWGRIREGKDLVEPRDDLDHTANFMWMLHGRETDEAALRAVDSYLVMLADHGMNASTFGARVTTGTQGDMYSAITTGIGTLKGPLHGGANERVMLMLLEADEAGDTEAWFKKAMDRGQRIMGMGHRVYKVVDPRAAVLRDLAQDMADSTGDRKWFDLAVQIERLARANAYFVERNLHANVDFYSAPVLYSAGIPIDFFTPMFAISRVAGWTAHVMEQWADNRLIRPRGQYMGPLEQAWVPLEKRK